VNALHWLRVRAAERAVQGQLDGRGPTAGNGHIDQLEAVQNDRRLQSAVRHVVITIA